MLVALQTQLQLPYRRDTWRTILRQLFSTVEFFAQPHDVPLTTERERAIASARRQIGVATFPDQDGASKKIAIYEIDVAANVDLPRNRVALRELVARSIDQVSANAVLAFFVQPERDEFRLTYAARESELDIETLEIKTRETAPKRFTFLLGPAEPCRTAAQRLGELADKRNILTIRNVERAFSVERLNKEFFTKYKQHYERFVKYLINDSDAPEKIFGIIASRENEEEFDRACKPLRDFVKRLLGRIVFLHFLQRKGWLGCPANGKAWENGDRDFMLNYFKLAERKKEAASFHSKWLTPLFFDALNNPDRARDIFEPTTTRIPYLNGGLFEESNTDARALDFPQNLFFDLLEFFAHYNFTIDENDPEENEVGIDPEMLGHIFENLLEDNRDKGSYYTPKGIVQYMCQQALLQYLRTHIGEHPELDRLVLEKDAGGASRTGSSWIRQNGQRIEQLIDNVKICDPAVGSGAFPIGMLNEMLQIKLALDFTLDPHEAKKTLVENSLHGVDIDPGAIEIARLRFWLSLVVDAKTPEPLPNLDYKLYCADSLIERIRGEAVNVGTKTPDNPQLRTAIENLVAAKHKLYGAHSKPAKREARHDLYAALGALAEIELVHLRNQDFVADQFGRIVGELEELKRLLHNLRLSREALAKKKAGVSVTHLDRALDAIQQWFENPTKSTFLWQLHFAEVFGDDGFHIVIANPPYVKEDVNRHAFDGLRSSECYQGKMDLWYLFGCRALNILRPSGVLCFIATNNWVTNDGASRFRNKVVLESRIIDVVDFGDHKVFAAGIQTMVFVLRKDLPPRKYALNYGRLLNERASPAVFKRFLSSMLPDQTPDYVRYISSVDCSEARDNYIRFLPASHEAIVQKILSHSDYYLADDDIHSGIDVMQDFVSKRHLEKLASDVCVGDGIFVLSDAEKQSVDWNAAELELIKPYYTTGEIGKYWARPENRYWIIYTTKAVNDKIDSYPNIRRHLDGFQSVITSVNRPYGLHRARKEKIFLGPKILAIRKCALPSFSLVNFSSYVSRAFLILKPTNFDLRCLLGLLNSKLVAFWLFNKGKLQGNQYQIDIIPLTKIPLRQVTGDTRENLSRLVENLLVAKDADPMADMSATEAEIDQIVYRLFGLTPEEIALIENSVPR